MTKQAMKLERRQPPHHAWLLAALLGAAALVLAYPQLSKAAWDPRWTQALLAGLVAALATAVGTLPVLTSRELSERTIDTLLGFGAGVMLAASAFSLINPAVESAIQLQDHRLRAGITVGAGILLGAGLLLLFDRLLPHEHFIKGMEGERASRLRRAWLFVFAIGLHNVPEGIAIGVAFAGPSEVTASALTSGIALQNVPEGLVVAVALRAAGYGRLRPALIGIASGLVEPAAAVLGATVATASTALLPWGLAFAAGAMLFVISHEIIPESHRKGHERQATSGLLLGFVLMLVIDVGFG